MIAINARLAYASYVRERADPGRRALRSCPSPASTWMTREEPNEAIRPIGSAFTAKLCLQQRARAA